MRPALPSQAQCQTGHGAKSRPGQPGRRLTFGSCTQSTLNSVKKRGRVNPQVVITCPSPSTRRGSHGALRSQLPVRRSLGEGGSTLRSFSHFFELLAEHLNITGRATAGGRVEAIDGNVKPVSFFAFHDEVTKTLGIGFVMPGLGDQIN